ncbi:MAG: hypothetical protein J7480_01160 [Microbacteriaceae bacterium]|nr:hypothetical protein [Microbacteriaceae bacterium]
MSRVADWWRRTDWGLHIAVTALSLLLAVLALELWRADLFIPFNYTGDALAVAAHFKTTFETGWYESQPLLGAPFGQVYHDFPTSDNANFLFASILGHLLGSWTLAMNVYFLIGFPLAGLAASWFIRVAGASKATTLATAPLFAVLSYHFMRGEPHMFLAAYFVIPLSLVLVLRAARGERLWGWREGSTHPVGRWFGRGVQTVVIAGLTGFTQAYYAVFALILLAVAGVVAVIRHRDWPRFWGAVAAGGIILAVVAVNMLPDTLYVLLHGPNPVGFQRGHADAEIYALKFAQLVLPWSGHRIGFLASIRQQYDSHYPLLSEQPSLGAVAAGGFVILLAIVVYRAIAGFRREAVTPRMATLSALGGLVLVAFLFATVGGMSTIISFVTASIRGWNRMSVIIALLCLAAVALLLDAWLERIAARARARAKRPGRVRAVWAGAFAVLVLLVGYVDQTPAGFGASYAPAIAQWRADAAYFQAIEELLEPGDWVVQLPYNAFPESQGPTGVLGSEVVIPYLHTTRVGWTGGGIKGRPSADWTSVLQAYPSTDVPAIAAAAGASGILLDRRAVPAAQQDLEPGLTTALGAPFASEDGRYAFWSLADTAADLGSTHPALAAEGMAEAILSPVTLDASKAFNVGWDATGRAVGIAPGGDVLGFDLINARGVPVAIDLAIELGGVDGEVTVTLDDGTVLLAEAGASGSASGRWTVTVPAGVHHASIALTAPGEVTLHWTVLDAAVSDAAVTETR